MSDEPRVNDGNVLPRLVLFWVVLIVTAAFVYWVAAP
mgnify:CR=1 FL=1